LTDSDRRARVLLGYEGQPDAQYGRDAWVPARSTLSSWLLVGPAPAQPSRQSREVQFLLYDRSENGDRLILPREERRQRTRAVRYRPREPSTAILLDEGPPEASGFGRLPPPESASAESLRLARTFRHAANLSE